MAHEHRDASLHVAYLGPPGTYSHQMALEFLATGVSTSTSIPRATTHSPVLVPKDTITQAAEFALSPRSSNSISNSSNSVQTATASTTDRHIAVLPLENSTHGPVTETLAVLNRYKDTYKILRRTSLTVRHALLVGSQTYVRLVQIEDDGSGRVTDKAMQSIQRIASHEQAIGQCKHFLDQHLPLTSQPGHRIEVSSTALAASQAAASHVDEDVLTAAIASDICADHGIYDVRIVRRSIQDRNDNVTKFIVVESVA